MRKRIPREGESEDQRNARLSYQRERSASNRSNETEDQRRTRLVDQRKRSASNMSNENEEQRNARLTDLRMRLTSYRSNENEDQRNTRLIDQRKRSAKNRLSNSRKEKTMHLKDNQRHSEATESFEGEQRITQKNETMNLQRQQRVSEKRQKNLLNKYQWPAAIPTELKEYCLEDFCYNTSMSVLRQVICVICNIRTSASTIKEYALQNIPNLEKLSCHADLMNIIPKPSETTQSEDFNCAVMFVNI